MFDVRFCRATRPCVPTSSLRAACLNSGAARHVFTGRMQDCVFDVSLRRATRLCAPTSSLRAARPTGFFTERRQDCGFDVGLCRATGLYVPTSSLRAARPDNGAARHPDRRPKAHRPQRRIDRRAAADGRRGLRASAEMGFTGRQQACGFDVSACRATGLYSPTSSLRAARPDSGAARQLFTGRQQTLVFDLRPRRATVRRPRRHLCAPAPADPLPGAFSGGKSALPQPQTRPRGGRTKTAGCGSCPLPPWRGQNNKGGR